MQVVTKSAMVGLASRTRGESIQNGSRQPERRHRESQDGDAAGGEQGKLGEAALGAFEGCATFEVVPDRLEQPASEQPVDAEQQHDADSAGRHRLDHDPATAVNITVIARSRKKIDVAIHR